MSMNSFLYNMSTRQSQQIISQTPPIVTPPIVTPPIVTHPIVTQSTQIVQSQNYQPSQSPKNSQIIPSIKEENTLSNILDDDILIEESLDDEIKDELAELQ